MSKLSARVVILFGSNYSFVDNRTGKLVEGSKLSVLTSFINDVDLKRPELVATGFPVLEFRFPYPLFIRQFQGIGVYDVVFEYTVNRKFELVQNLVSISFVEPLHFDFLENPLDPDPVAENF